MHTLAKDSDYVDRTPTLFALNALCIFIAAKCSAKLLTVPIAIRLLTSGKLFTMLFAACGDSRKAESRSSPTPSSSSYLMCSLSACVEMIGNG